MELPISERDIAQAESYLAAGDLPSATPLLERLVEQAEEYIDAECQATDKVQYFSFADAFERLAYRRVERDPRELVQVGAPFDRLYAALSFAYINQEDYVSAKNTLTQAVRWDPMNCAYRLDLAELHRALGNTQEWAALSFSVIERASDGRSAARAYANLGLFVLDEENLTAASACARPRACASRWRAPRRRERLCSVTAGRKSFSACGNCWRCKTDGLAQDFHTILR